MSKRSSEDTQGGASSVSEREAKKQRNDSPATASARAAVAAVIKQCNDIQTEFGESWGAGDKSKLAVSKVEALPITETFFAVSELEDVDARWNLGMELSLAVADMIYKAEEAAGTAVSDEWCPNASTDVVDFWRGVCGKEERPSEEIGEEAKYELITCLGDYGELGFVFGMGEDDDEGEEDDEEEEEGDDEGEGAVKGGGGGYEDEEDYEEDEGDDDDDEDYEG